MVARAPFSVRLRGVRFALFRLLVAVGRLAFVGDRFAFLDLFDHQEPNRAHQVDNCGALEALDHSRSTRSRSVSGSVKGRSGKALEAVAG